MLQEQDPYASIAKPLNGDPYAGIAKPLASSAPMQQQPDALTRGVQSYSQAVGAPEKIEDVPSGIKYFMQHPLDSAKLLYESMSDAQQKTIDKAYEEQHSPDWMTKAKGVVRGVYSSLPLVGPVLSKAGDQFGSGDIAGGVGTTAGLATGMLLPSGEARANLASGAKAAVDAVPTPRGALAAKMAEKPMGSSFTRGELVDAARANGVNLDLAQATGSKVAGVVKRANEHSLTGNSTYETNTANNLSALEQWANSETSKYAPEAADREVVGGQIQQALKSDLEAKKTAAQSAYNELDKVAGSVPVDVSQSIASEAQKIIAENKDYYAKHPELKPGKAWAILEDLASKTPGKPVPKSVGGAEVIDASGAPIMQKGPAGGPKIEPWSDLHSLRSDLMDFYRNNPDIVKGRSEAWIQQMVGKIDDAMTNGASGLSPENLAKFRQANSIWENIKSTYDNNQSPLYQAVRAQFKSQVPGMLSKGTPELARSVRDTLGSLDGPFQRQFVETLLKDKNGNLDLGRLNQRLKGIPYDHLVAMIGEDGARNLKLMGETARKVMTDSNPSGTAKSMQPNAELVAAGTATVANPAVGIPAAAAKFGGDYLAAKFINSPKVVDFLTKKKR